MAGAFDVPGALDDVCDRIEAGETMAAIAKRYKVHRSQLTRWMLGDPERELRIKAARIASADALAEMALDGILKARSRDALMRARDAAHHYRWLASKRDPRNFGEKVQVGGAEDLPPVQTHSTVDMSGLSLEQLRAIASIRIKEG